MSQTSESPLWTRCKAGDPAAREQLIEANIRLVGFVRLRFFSSPPVHITASDLESEGYLYLIKAVDNFDPTRGFAFTTFATSYIKGGMLRWLRHEDPDSPEVFTREQDLRRAERECVKRGEEPTEEALRSEMRMTPRKWIAFTKGMVRSARVSLDANVAGCGNATFADIIPSEEDVEAAVIRRMGSDRVNEWLELLPLRERRVLQMRYVERETIEAAAQAMGCSKQSALNWERSAIRILRHQVKLRGLSA